jgi:hypothetical protein
MEDDCPSTKKYNLGVGSPNHRSMGSFGASVHASGVGGYAPTGYTGVGGFVVPTTLEYYNAMSPCQDGISGGCFNRKTRGRSTHHSVSDP